jgi:uracil-DNA glycosylase family 4
MSSCRDCPRLASYLAELRLQYPDYHCQPVKGWGFGRPRLLIVGLAPGLHGANRTGKPFTGDSSGQLLFKMLREFAWASGNEGQVTLQQVRIVNAVRCVPPGNRPTSAEIRTCNDFLLEELNRLTNSAVILSLGTIAHRAVLMALGESASIYGFSHGRVHLLPDGRQMIDSYHCSRYNTQTRRLTVEMFRSIFRKISELIDEKQ